MSVEGKIGAAATGWEAMTGAARGKVLVDARMLWFGDGSGSLSVVIGVFVIPESFIATEDDSPARCSDDDANILST